jgi:hydrogenase expression/formation protein HypC
MCLAVPAKLIQRDGDDALADLHGNHVRINTLLVPEAKVGDWVLIHAGFAIQQLNEEEAEATFAVLKDLQVAAGANDEPTSG